VRLRGKQPGTRTIKCSMAIEERWNHNIHYHSVILAALPQPCDRVLEVGCGEGFLVGELSAVARQVTAMDIDAPTIQLAKQEATATNIGFVLDDFMAHPFEPDSFDAAVSVSTLHHMDAAAAICKMRQLVRPGGTIAAIGLARSRRLRDYALEIVGVVSTRVHRLRKPYWDTRGPKVWPPAETYRQTRIMAEALLPGVRYRRHIFFRYSRTYVRVAVDVVWLAEHEHEFPEGPEGNWVKGGRYPQLGEGDSH
jgi:SAM-dependent methyltransferase